ncbi:MAG: C10 family peptidase [Bacteroidales bacterium]|nr:C10 family peptidase [Bacteroidales bacterium]
MKKFLLLTLLLLPLMAYATPMPESSCRKVASQFLRSQGRTCDFNTLQLVGDKPGTKSIVDPGHYYIYNTPGKGFVIVAGDDTVTPVIAYSTSGQFCSDERMSNFNYWMGIWSSIIESNRSKGIEASGTTKSEWSRYLEGGSPRAESGDEILHETALWNQGDPYNIYCPLLDGERTLTGCVATAMGIVMKYFEWPVAGKGTIPSYTSGGVTVPELKLGEPYDWKNMPSSLTSGSTEAQKHAVATLLYHAGVIVTARYGTSGTGAQGGNIRQAMVDHMGYDPSATLRRAAMYTSAEWVEMLKNNIKNVGPTLYGGFNGAGGGHQFVMTGYDASDRFYINWGWGGANNGYYAYPGIGEFTIEQDAIFNLSKNHGGSYQTEVSLYHGDPPTKPGITLDCAEIVKGVPFSATVEFFANLGDVPFEGKVGIIRANSANEVLEVLSEKDFSIEPYSYNSTTIFEDCVITTDAEIGEKLACGYKCNGEDKWSMCRYDLEDASMTGVIPLIDPFTIEQSTSISYSVEGFLRITSKKGVGLKLLGPGGEDMSSAVSLIDENSWTIDLKSLSPAKYKIQLSKDKEFKEISVSMGLKK